MSAFDAYPNGARVEYHCAAADGGKVWVPATVTGRTKATLHIATSATHAFSLTAADVKRDLRYLSEVPRPVEITRFALGANGTHNRGFTIDGVRVLLGGDDDDKIAQVAGDLAEAATALERAEARRVELQAEIERVGHLYTQLSAAVTPKAPQRPAQLMGPGCVRFDPATGEPWLLNTREKGWSAWGVILDDWDDLFRRFNVRVTGHGVDGAGAWWEVTPIAPTKEQAS